MKKKGKALFIIHDVYQEDNTFPLGPAYLIACLKQAGHEVETYCMDVFHYTNEELGSFLEEREYDLIGMGFLAARFTETVVDVCRVINKYKKKSWFQLGGHGPSCIPEYILKTTEADIIGIGECEETIVELMECKLNSGDLSKIKGIAYRNGEEVKINPRREPIRNLDSIPFPAWEEFPMEKYVGAIKEAFAENEQTFAMISSRGCVNECNFCYRMEKGIRIRSIEKVVEEIKILNTKYDVSVFEFQDELFVLSKERIIKFNELLKGNQLKIKYTATCRADIFDEEMAVLLKESGCNFLNIGFESTSQDVLNFMNKNTTVEENIKAAEIATKVGINIGLNFIWGEPGDTAETLRQSAEFIKKYNTYSQIRTVRPVTPYPGCDLYNYAIEKGLLKGPQDFFNRFKNSDLITVNFTNMTDNEMYNVLFEVNKDLILDHFNHTNKDMTSAQELIESFYNLYYKGEIKFRGARKYTEDDVKNLKSI